MVFLCEQLVKKISSLGATNTVYRTVSRRVCLVRQNLGEIQIPDDDDDDDDDVCIPILGMRAGQSNQ